MKHISHIKGFLKIAAMILGTSTIGAAVSACGQADGAGGSPPPQLDNVRKVRVETIIVTPREFSEKVQVTGVVDARRDVTISAEAGGRVVEIVELGAAVTQGSVIARFDERLLKSQLEAAEASYQLAEDTFRRQKALYEDSVISALEYENVLSRRDQAAAALEQARKMYADTRLTSPISGRVEERFVEQGELVGTGSPVVRVVDTRRVKVRSGVPERYAAEIAEGARAWIRLPSAGVESESRLTFVGRVVDPKSRTFTVEVELENPSAHLKPEMVVDVSIERRSLENALVIPQTALVRDDLGTGLYVVEDDGDQRVASRRTIVTGASFDGMVVIEAGLHGGEEVVIVGQSNLTDGNPVEIVGPVEGDD
ncbi:MAG TPA: efflux RND transporter periplasmic adaptor subunit [Rhodothermales bacterium]|nr:efflux RND transporter periplasmic adaptor subunit [Rhodothermales bacterium]